MALLESPSKVSSINKNNIIERLLYTPPLIDKSSNQLSHTYERGLFISIDNYRMFAEKILGLYKRQYQSLVKTTIGTKLSKDDIKVVKGIPNRDIISKLCYNKIPIVVAGIHDYPEEDNWKQYQHQHLFVYNLHHYLPDDVTELSNKINQLDIVFMRYIGWKNRWKTNKDFIVIEPVGNGKYLYGNDKVTPTTLYDYLMKKEFGTCINYISNNKHQKDDYPLYTIYSTLKQL